MPNPSNSGSLVVAQGELLELDESSGYASTSRQWSTQGVSDSSSFRAHRDPCTSFGDSCLGNNGSDRSDQVGPTSLGPAGIAATAVQGVPSGAMPRPMLQCSDNESQQVSSGGVATAESVDLVSCVGTTCRCSKGLSFEKKSSGERRSLNVALPGFVGSGSLSVFLAQLRMSAEYLEWDDQELLYHLAMCLTGPGPKCWL